MADCRVSRHPVARGARAGPVSAQKHAGAERDQAPERKRTRSDHRRRGGPRQRFRRSTVRRSRLPRRFGSGHGLSPLLPPPLAPPRQKNCDGCHDSETAMPFSRLCCGKATAGGMIAVPFLLAGQLSENLTVRRRRPAAIAARP